MANRMYTEGIDALLTGGIDLDTDTFKAVLVDTALYTPNTANAGHANLSDIASGARVATSASFTGITADGGVFDGGDITFTGVGGEASCEAVVIYKDTGVAATSKLVCIFDTAIGLPYTPPGGAWTLTVQWDNGTNKIFKVG